MPGTLSGSAVRERLDGLIRALETEDLEERVAPVKCSKHPDAPECATYYGGPDYGAPEYGTPDYGVPGGG